MPTCQYNLDCTRATSALYAAQSWVAMGGNPDKAVIAVAVAMSESCLDPYATSETCAVGLWQIEPDIYIPGRPSMDSLQDIGVNAAWAVELSSNGTNWSAWDTCYAAGESLTRRYTIVYPERGSKAYANIPIAQAALSRGTYSGVTRGKTVSKARYAYAAEDCGAWWDGCYDTDGGNYITPDQGYQYILNAGFSGGVALTMLGLMSRESSFSTTVTARCPPGPCDPDGVESVGLLQINIVAHPKWSHYAMAQPQLNCNAAYELYRQNPSLSDWTPLQGWDTPGGQAIAQLMLNNALAHSDPGVSLANDVTAAPNVGNAPPLANVGTQPNVTPPTPVLHVDYIDFPAMYSESRSGWDAIAWHYSNDVPYYTGYDAEIVRRLGSLLEGRL